MSLFNKKVLQSMIQYDVVGHDAVVHDMVWRHHTANEGTQKFTPRVLVQFLGTSIILYFQIFSQGRGCGFKIFFLPNNSQDFSDFFFRNFSKISPKTIVVIILELPQIFLQIRNNFWSSSKLLDSQNFSK